MNNDIYGGCGSKVFNEIFTSIWKDIDNSDKNDKDEEDNNDLGKGMSLVSIFHVMPELLDNKEMMKEMGCRKDYCFLFKGGKQVSDKVFRRGNINNGYNNGDYASLIVYHDFFNKKADYKFRSKTVLVDLEGNIVLEESGLNKYPVYLKGVIGYLDNMYYNLRSGELIVGGNASISSDEYIFVEKKYDFNWYGGKDKPLGVYKICFSTGEVEYFK